MAWKTTPWSAEVCHWKEISLVEKGFVSSLYMSLCTCGRSPLIKLACRWETHTYTPEKKMLTHTYCKLEFEWWSFKESGTVVVTARCKAVGSCLLYIHTIDNFIVASDLTNWRPSVPQKYSTKSIEDTNTHPRCVKWREGEWETRESVNSLSAVSMLTILRQ